MADSCPGVSNGRALGSRKWPWFPAPAFRRHPVPRPTHLSAAWIGRDTPPWSQNAAEERPLTRSSSADPPFPRLTFALVSWPFGFGEREVCLVPSDTLDNLGVAPLLKDFTD